MDAYGVFVEIVFDKLKLDFNILLVQFFHTNVTLPLSPFYQLLEFAAFSVPVIYGQTKIISVKHTEGFQICTI